MTFTAGVLSEGALNGGTRLRNGFAAFAMRLFGASVLSAVIGNPGILWRYCDRAAWAGHSTLV
jgi:hypothetical protein